MFACLYYVLCMYYVLCSGLCSVFYLAARQISLWLKHINSQQVGAEVIYFQPAETKHLSSLIINVNRQRISNLNAEENNALDVFNSVLYVVL